MFLIIFAIFAESEINQSGSNVSSKLTSGLSWAVSSIAAKLTRTRDETQDSAANSSNKIGNLPATSSVAASKGITNTSQAKSISHSDHQPSKAALGTSDDSKSFTSDMDSHVADDWDDNNGWDNDDDIITNELGEFKFEDDKPSTTSKNKIAPIKEKNTANSWDDDFPMDDWNSDWQSTDTNSGTHDKGGTFSTNDEHIFKEPVVRKPERVIERSRTGGNTASSTLAKKGPMKLGAQKSSKMN